MNIATPKNVPQTPRPPSGHCHDNYRHAALTGIAGKLMAVTIGERHHALTAAAARMFELRLSDTYVAEFISDAANQLNESGDARSPTARSMPYFRLGRRSGPAGDRGMTDPIFKFSDFVKASGARPARDPQAQEIPIPAPEPDTRNRANGSPTPSRNSPKRLNNSARRRWPILNRARAPARISRTWMKTNTIWNARPPPRRWAASACPVWTSWWRRSGRRAPTPKVPGSPQQQQPPQQRDVTSRPRHHQKTPRSHRADRRIQRQILRAARTRQSHHLRAQT